MFGLSVLQFEFFKLLEVFSSCSENAGKRSNATATINVDTPV